MRKMKKYNFGITGIDYGKILFRLNPKLRELRFFQTNIQKLDWLLGGGLRYGLNLFVGDDGSGKSKLARKITNNCGKRVLYVITEDYYDNPITIENKDRVSILDYTFYQSAPKKCIDEVLVACEKLEPDLLVIDSLTGLLGGTTKSVIEADIRENTFYLAKKLCGILPCIAISQMRGEGWEKRSAGGTAIYHASILTLVFGVFIVKTKEMQVLYDIDVGNRIWTLYVRKDRLGKAKSDKVYEVIYDESDEFILHKL